MNYFRQWIYNFFVCLFVTATTSGTSIIKKVNMIYLSKELTNKDQTLKMQMLLSSDGDNAKNTENIWPKNVFFGYQKGEFTIFKPNFPENTLIYCNQGTIFMMKAGDHAFYMDYVVLGQLIPALNCPQDIDNYVSEKSKLNYLCLCMIIFVVLKSGWHFLW